MALLYTVALSLLLVISHQGFFQIGSVNNGDYFRTTGRHLIGLHPDEDFFQLRSNRRFAVKWLNFEPGSKEYVKFGLLFYIGNTSTSDLIIYVSQFLNGLFNKKHFNIYYLFYTYAAVFILMAYLLFSFLFKSSVLRLTYFISATILLLFIGSPHITAYFVSFYQEAGFIIAFIFLLVSYLYKWPPVIKYFAYFLVLIAKIQFIFFWPLLLIQFAIDILRPSRLKWLYFAAFLIISFQAGINYKVQSATGRVSNLSNSFFIGLLTADNRPQTYEFFDLDPARFQKYMGKGYALESENYSQTDRDEFISKYSHPKLLFYLVSHPVQTFKLMCIGISSISRINAENYIISSLKSPTGLSISHPNLTFIFVARFFPYIYLVGIILLIASIVLLRTIRQTELLVGLALALLIPVSYLTSIIGDGFNEIYKHNFGTLFLTGLFFILQLHFALKLFEMKRVGSIPVLQNGD